MLACQQVSIYLQISSPGRNAVGVRMSPALLVIGDLRWYDVSGVSQYSLCCFVALTWACEFGGEMSEPDTQASS